MYRPFFHGDTLDEKGSVENQDTVGDGAQVRCVFFVSFAVCLLGRNHVEPIASVSKAFLRECFACVKTVSKPLRFELLELCLSEKQTPKVIVFVRSRQNQGERLEPARVRSRQVCKAHAEFDNGVQVFSSRLRSGLADIEFIRGLVPHDTAPETHLLR